MIEFNCQHCGKLLRLNDSYAGRDGWCRVCKRMVIVPDGTGPARIEDLPPEVGYARMQRLLQYAATKADQYKVHLAREAQEGRPKPELDPAVERAERTLAAYEARYALLQHENEAAQASLESARQRAASLESTITRGEQRLAEQSGEAAAVEAALQSERALRGDLEARLLAAESACNAAASARDEALEALEAQRREAATDLAERQLEWDEARQSLEASREDAAAALAEAQREHARIAAELSEAGETAARQVRDLEGELAAARRRQAEAESERDRLARDLDEVSTGDQDSAGLVLEKEKEIGALHGEIARMLAEADAREGETAARIGALEAEMAGLASAGARETQLAAQIEALEIARTEGTLALDSARREAEQAARHVEALEASAREAAEAGADHIVALEHLKRDLAARDGQVRRLSEELETLTAEQTATVLERDKAVRTLRAAENRAGVLAADLESLQERYDTLSSETASGARSLADLHARMESTEEDLLRTRAAAAKLADATTGLRAAEVEVASLREQLGEAEARLGAQSDAAAAHAAQVEALEASRQVLEAEAVRLREVVEQAGERAVLEREQAEEMAASYESEITTLKGALEGARQAANADTEAIASSIASAEAEAASARDELRHARAEWESERVHLSGMVTDLEAELMNLNLALETAESEAAGVGAIQEVAEMRATALELAQARVQELEARASALEGVLSTVRSEKEALQDALAAGGGPEFDDGEGFEGDDVIVLEAHAPGGAGRTTGAGDPVAEKLRLQEKKEMMDVLSDFLNK